MRLQLAKSIFAPPASWSHQIKIFGLMVPNCNIKVAVQHIKVLMTFVYFGYCSHDYEDCMSKDLVGNLLSS